MQAGGITLGDCMRRHLVTLEREQRNLEQSMELCRRLKERDGPLEGLDARELLEEMEAMEKAGTTFLNRQVGDTRRLRYVAPAVVTVLTVLLMGGLMGLMLWGFAIDAADAPPLPLVAVLVALPAVVILGVVAALWQRVKEIQKGEADDAKNY